MATQMIYQNYSQNKGTLVPGQSIAVNKYTVQVERYLSQGGFAHVYLVRTATPIFGTTHHVLKRIAVANEAMLTEVKKEVDIMRLLQGHPNIVYLIDAAWHRMANGQFEVFILMEYCPGGGIIDMMNRRLRERLTEAEILQIFMDVCEGVACMHNLRPPLLHRDLKVENILQSSPTSYKLCDFGSATTVATRPPATTQEIRALEADLNRHTTLQYRAPEMVDPYLRRPVDEKSDVWALGVLLYKLCFYTTPFEEHGPLAILNVQYRIPPYPVYSPQMNGLIASMLREHGSQRPTSFEILNHVHHLRGTKSKFHYNIPPPQPLSPRHHPQATVSGNPLESTISYRHSQLTPAVKRPDTNGSPLAPPGSAKGQGVQAREKVLEAIAPMRRGRPHPSSKDAPGSRPATPQKPGDPPLLRRTGWVAGLPQTRDLGIVRAIGLVPHPKDTDDPWVVAGGNTEKPAGKKDPSTGFGDDFSGKVWALQDPNAPPSSKPRPSQASNDVGRSPTIPIRAPAFTGSDLVRTRDFAPPVRLASKDAFDGLGLPPAKPAPTLAEARKLRTGLAILSASGSQLGYSSSSTLTQPLKSQSPAQPTSRPPSNVPPDGLPAESRFPSLAELDASFPPTAPAPARGSLDLYPSSVVSHSFKQTSALPSRQSNDVSPSGHLLKPSSLLHTSRTIDGTRSEQVTGVAMRDNTADRGNLQSSSIDTTAFLSPGSQSKVSGSGPKPTAQPNPGSSPSRFRASPSHSTESMGAEPKSFTSSSFMNPGPTPNHSRFASSSYQSKDWLTGDVDISSSSLAIAASLATSPSAPVVRNSPGKRASVIQNAPLSVQPSAGQRGLIDTRRSPSPQPPDSRGDVSPTMSKFQRNFPSVEMNDPAQNLAVPLMAQTARGSPRGRGSRWGHNTAGAYHPDATDQVSSGDEGPEDPDGTFAFKRGGSTATRKGKRRQSSVHELVGLWSGGSHTKEKEAEPAWTSITSSTSLGKESSFYTNGPDAARPPPLSHLAPHTLDPDTMSSSRPVTTEQRRQPSPTPSPDSRSRPQSMFIFPSRVTEPPPSTPAGLAESPRPRNPLRRTSISDMVQRFEAIGGRAKPNGGAGPPSPTTPRAVGYKSNASMDSGRLGRSPGNNHAPSTPSAELGALKFPSDMLSVPNDSSSPSGFDSFHRDQTKRRTSPSPSARTSPGLPRAPPSPGQVGFSTDRDATEEIAPRARTSSFRPDRPETKLNFPLRRTTVDEKTPSSPKTGEAPAQSPERPYQGVGKLIDQWQRKTAEAEAQTTSKRTFTPKRTPAVQSRGQ